VASLFEEYYELVPPDTCYQSVVLAGRRDEFGAIVVQLLPDGVAVQTEAGDLSFSVHGTTLPFGALADGYRAFIGWIFDLLYHLTQCAPSEIPLTHMRGVVIVDEVDLFLHPEWQRVVLSKIASTFPNLQFILSTHSPILAGTVETRNTLVTEIDPDTNSTTVVRPKESIYGLSADQILTSAYFGLSTTRAPGAEDGLDEIA
jgi:hypothetical protein